VKEHKTLVARFCSVEALKADEVHMAFGEP
jgi:hypothetical protein